MDQPEALPGQYKRLPPTGVQKIISAPVYVQRERGNLKGLALGKCGSNRIACAVGGRAQLGYIASLVL